MDRGGFPVARNDEHGGFFRKHICMSQIAATRLWLLRHEGKMIDYLLLLDPVAMIPSSEQ